MKNTIQECGSMIASGLTVRTKNSDEFDPATAKIGALWGEFFAKHLNENMPNMSENRLMLGVYSNYETDASGHFDVTAAMAVDAPCKDFANVEIPAGRYMVFECEGDMPMAVIEGWGRVWQYFQNEAAHKRLYQTDYEAYLGPTKAAIYIGVA